MSSTFMPFHVTPLDDMDFMYNVNQKGTFLCMQEQIKIMLKQDKQGDAGKRGVIVNMASMSGLIGVPYAAPYSSTKHAVSFDHTPVPKSSLTPTSRSSA
jgi:short-subunit dehydrogenase